MLRCVLDTDVIIAAMRSPSGASAAILLAALDSPFILLASAPLALEYEAKCLLPEHREVAGLDEQQTLTFLNTIIGLMEPVELNFRWRPQLRDPGDEMVLETAINGRADLLVTFNLRDYGEAPKRFGVRALRPADALKRIRI